MIFHNLKEIFQSEFYIPPFKNEDLRIFRALKKWGAYPRDGKRDDGMNSNRNRNKNEEKRKKRKRNRKLPFLFVL